MAVAVNTRCLFVGTMILLLFSNLISEIAMCNLLPSAANERNCDFELKPHQTRALIYKAFYLTTKSTLVLRDF